MKVKCPDCDAEFEIDNDYRIGDITSCPACGIELELKSNSVVIVDNVINKVVQVQELTITGEDWGE